MTREAAHPVPHGAFHPVSREGVIVVVPVFNHAKTLRPVVAGVLRHHPHVLVVDDGSTDLPGAGSIIASARPVAAGGAEDAALSVAVFPPEHPLRGLDAACIRHPENRGKGAAILSAARAAGKAGLTHIITIDADGQHDPAEIRRFLEAMDANPEDILVGFRDFTAADVPFSSRFGRGFSNFWFTVQTGERVRDTQSGFRAYPLAVLERVACTDSRYSFETEILVKAVWAGCGVRDVPVSVYYPPKKERISHFHMVTDNLRLTWLNTRLTIRSAMPVPHRKHGANDTGEISALRPLRSLRIFLSRNETPGNLAFSVSLGVAIGTLPLIGVQGICVLLAAGALRANRIAALAACQICAPPVIPALCVEVGHYLRQGRFLTEISLQTLGYEALDRIWEWILGSLVLAPFFACVMWGVTFVFARGVRAGLRAKRGEGKEHGAA